jgi:hypothetical protein
VQQAQRLIKHRDLVGLQQLVPHQALYCGIQTYLRNPARFIPAFQGKKQGF